MKISAVILTKNEEKNIGNCLRSVMFCDEIVVVDDYSTDKTADIIRRVVRSKPHKILQRKLAGDFAGQRNFGLSEVNNDWVLFVDADEVVSPQLKREIKKLKFNEDAYALKRRDFFWGKELRYGEVSRVRRRGITRLVKKKSGYWQGNVHEIFYTAKSVAVLNGFIDHYPHPSLKDFLHSINTYSSLRAVELYDHGVKVNLFDVVSFPLAKFLYNYLLSLGFIDGPEGFVYAFLMSFHSFLVRAKLYQFYQLKSG
ncbi:glycosyltransferase family 2 protein [Patescibacteria group bacterium]|nr:glycosyltransferase family 2 protein [Patescibacteria group bacterium]